MKLLSNLEKKNNHNNYFIILFLLEIFNSYLLCNKITRKLLISPWQKNHLYNFNLNSLSNQNLRCHHTISIFPQKPPPTCPHHKGLCLPLSPSPGKIYSGRKWRPFLSFHLPTNGDWGNELGHAKGTLDVCCSWAFHPLPLAGMKMSFAYRNHHHALSRLAQGHQINGEYYFRYGRWCWQMLFLWEYLWIEVPIIDY